MSEVSNGQTTSHDPESNISVEASPQAAKIASDTTKELPTGESEQPSTGLETSNASIAHATTADPQVGSKRPLDSPESPVSPKRQTTDSDPFKSMTLEQRKLVLTAKARSYNTTADRLRETKDSLKGLEISAEHGMTLTETEQQEMTKMRQSCGTLQRDLATIQEQCIQLSAGLIMPAPQIQALQLPFKLKCIQFQPKSSAPAPPQPSAPLLRQPILQTPTTHAPMTHTPGLLNPPVAARQPVLPPPVLQVSAGRGRGLAHVQPHPPALLRNPPQISHQNFAAPQGQQWAPRVGTATASFPPPPAPPGRFVQPGGIFPMVGHQTSSLLPTPSNNPPPRPHMGSAPPSINRHWRPT